MITRNCCDILGTGPNRRAVLGFGLAAGAWALARPALAQEWPGIRDFATLRDFARALARAPYRPVAEVESAALRDLTYDQYRAIRPQPLDAWPADRPFSLQPFHPGFLYKRPVSLHVVSGGAVRRVPYDPGQFDLSRVEGVDLSRLSAADGRGFGGFRLHHGAGPPAAQVEFAVFQGASYFRLRGDGQEYGLSGRGVALNTGGPGAEEFPDFVAFWLLEPGAEVLEVEVLALLDGPSLAGAYRFTVRPGVEAAMAVECALYPRRPLGKLGLAPLTSMFLAGENGGPPGHDDFRPEVHDSDGLLLHADGDWTWRALVNARAEAVLTDLPVRDLRGFGLMQRDRDFRSYLDVEARQEDRPSAWVVPRGDWGPGKVQLYTFPSVTEFADNVVASFIPDRVPGPGEELRLAYDFRVFGTRADLPPLGRVTATRTGSADGLRPLPEPVPGRRLYMVDWEGGLLPSLEKGAPLAVELTATAGIAADPYLERVTQTRGWRLYFDHRPGEGPATLTARLLLDGKPVTETWRYDG